MLTKVLSERGGDLLLFLETEKNLDGRGCVVRKVLQKWNCSSAVEYKEEESKETELSGVLSR